MEEESYLNDAKFENILGKINVQRPLLQCVKGHQISIVCISSQCKHNSFFCNICDAKLHPKCKKQLVDTIYMNLQESVENQKEILKEIYYMGNKLVYVIKKKQEQLIEKALLIGYQKNIRLIIENIFVKKQINKILGKDMQLLRQALLQKIQSKPQTAKQIESSYFQIKNKIEDDFDKLITMDTSFKSYGLQMSYIVKNLEDEKFIYKSLQSIKPLKYLRLIYRASQNAYNSVEFHKKCDDFEHTLIIIRTQFGKTIAGYTPIKWGHQTKYGVIFKGDYSKKSFLLQVDLKQKMTLKQQQNAIIFDSSQGPIFGCDGAADIFIYDKCNVFNNSYANFPKSYNFASKPYQNNQKSYTIFSGATNGCNFKVLEYQVYKVQFI